MDNPVAVVKNNLTVSKLVGFIVVAIAVFAIAEVTGLTTWILQPVGTFRSKFLKPNAAP